MSNNNLILTSNYQGLNVHSFFLITLSAKSFHMLFVWLEFWKHDLQYTIGHQSKLLMYLMNNDIINTVNKSKILMIL